MRSGICDVAQWFVVGPLSSLELIYEGKHRQSSTILRMGTSLVNELKVRDRIFWKNKKHFVLEKASKEDSRMTRYKKTENHQRLWDLLVQGKSICSTESINASEKKIFVGYPNKNSNKAVNCHCTLYKNHFIAGLQLKHLFTPSVYINM